VQGWKKIQSVLTLNTNNTVKLTSHSSAGGHALRLRVKAVFIPITAAVVEGVTAPFIGMVVPVSETGTTGSRYWRLHAVNWKSQDIADSFRIILILRRQKDQNSSKKIYVFRIYHKEWNINHLYFCPQKYPAIDWTYGPLNRKTRKHQSHIKLTFSPSLNELDLKFIQNIQFPHNLLQPSMFLTKWWNKALVRSKSDNKAASHMTSAFYLTSSKWQTWAF